MLFFGNSQRIALAIYGAAYWPPIAGFFKRLKVARFSLSCKTTTTARGHGAGRSLRTRPLEEMITSPRQTCQTTLLAVEAQKYMAKLPRAVHHLHLRRFTKILIESRSRARGSAVSTRRGEGIIKSHHTSSPVITSRLAALSESGQARCRLGRKAGSST